MRHQVKMMMRMTLKLATVIFCIMVCNNRILSQYVPATITYLFF